MKKYLYLLIVIVLGVSISACSKAAAATEVPADAGAPVDSGTPVDSGVPADTGAATEAPVIPADSGAPDEMGGFLFAPMPGEYEPQVDVRDFIGVLREESGISGHLQLVSAMPAGTAWDAILGHYDGQAKANGWVLEKTEDVTTPKGYLCSVALFTHGNNKILLAYYPLNGEIVILQIQGE